MRNNDVPKKRGQNVNYKKRCDNLKKKREKLCTGIIGTFQYVQRCCKHFAYLHQFVREKNVIVNKIKININFF